MAVRSDESIEMLPAAAPQIGSASYVAGVWQIDNWKKNDKRIDRIVCWDGDFDTDGIRSVESTNAHHAHVQRQAMA